jgi:hypothetical protein
MRVKAEIARQKLWGAEPSRVQLMLLVGSPLLLSLAVTNQSLWIDEAVMAYFASYDRLGDMFVTVTDLRTSDPQMPLYIVYLWGWVKLFGASEYALRAANLPFAILFVAAMAWTSWRALGRPALWVVFCLSPFVWFYMNEARPYVAIMACAALSTGAVMVYFAEPERYGKIAPWLCLSALWVACGLQMLSVFLAPSLAVLAAFALREKRRDWSMIRRDWTVPLFVHSPLFLALGGYFVWTLSVGAGGMRETPGFGNLAFAFYEFVGFAGLGPPRHVMRAQPNLQVLVPYWPWLGIGALAIGGFLSVSLLQIVRRRAAPPGSVIALITGVALFVACSVVVEFRFWGRHLAVFFPLVSFILIAAMGAALGARPWKRIGFTCVASLACVWILSDARLWALPEYQKDDYRLAASTALAVAQRSDASIVWAANLIAGRYYGFEFDQPLAGVEWRSVGKAIFGANWSRPQVSEYLSRTRRENPVVLVLSKPDLYDSAGIWTAAVEEFRAEKVASPNSFNIYLFERSRNPVESATLENTSRKS